MKFADYIDLLSTSDLDKKMFDRAWWSSPFIPDSISEYEKAVLKWFKGDKKKYVSEYGDSKSLSSDLATDIKDNIKILKESLNIQKENIAKDNNLSISQIHSKYDKIISELNKIITDMNVSLQSISNKIPEILWSVDWKTSIEEIRDALDGFYTQGEVEDRFYDKEEIDSKFSTLHDKKWIVSVTTWGGVPIPWWSDTEVQFNNAWALGWDENFIWDNVTKTLGAENIVATTLNVITLLTVATIVSTNVVRLKGYTVATLPAGTIGDTAYCTNLLAPTFFTVAVGGGAVVWPVFYNWSAWICT